jgi:hypothetical protein
MAQRRVKFAGREIPLPASRLLRLALGTILVVGGILGFLPILGFWMVPLGLIVLSADIALIRSLRRKAEVWFGRRVYPAWRRLRARWQGRPGPTPEHDSPRQGE